jgi:endonuclease-3
MFDKKKLDALFSTFAEHNSEPDIELDFINQYTFLVAIVLSARTTDVQVNKATDVLFKVVRSPEQMLALGEKKLLEYVKTIGLYKTKAKRIIELSRILIEKYHSKVPDNFEDLCSLPGVGSKSARVFLNTACQKPVIAVDTHVFRVSRRLGLTHATTIPKVEADLEKIIPDEWKLRAHHWLVLHGRYVCKARKPECGRCIVSSYCDYFKSNYPKTK